MIPRRSCAASLVMAAFVMASFNTVFAQSTAPGAIVITEEVVVEGRLMEEEEVAEETLDAIPGATGIIVGTDLTAKANLNISDALASTPGVIVQNFFGGNDQPRIQIRGSGLQQNPVERGILVLQNGLPINRADGSYIVGMTDPRQAQFTEVYRGYTANLGSARPCSAAPSTSSRQPVRRHPVLRAPSRAASSGCCPARSSSAETAATSTGSRR